MPINSFECTMTLSGRQINIFYLKTIRLYPVMFFSMTAFHYHTAIKFLLISGIFMSELAMRHSQQLNQADYRLRKRG